MTPKDFQKAIREFAREVDPKQCHVSAYISYDGYVVDKSKGVVRCTCYPRGYDSGRDSLTYSVDADTFEEVLVKLRDQWTVLEATTREKMTRRIALVIIRLTHETGECTDAGLRAEFTQDEITRYGADACTLANSMAERGPFSIVSKSGANGAPDHLPTDDDLDQQRVH